MAGDVQFIAFKTIGLSRVNGRKPCTLVQAAAHNLRQLQGELGALGRIDPGRSAENVLVSGPDTPEGVQSLATSLLAEAGIDPAKMRRDRVQALELVVSLPPGAAIDAEGYFARCMAWLAKALPLPILLATAHNDESAPHLHALLLPVLDGQYVGGRPIERAALLRLRESFFKEVAGPAGLQRTGAKLRGASKALAVAAVLERCEAMGLPAANGPLWPVLLAAIERDPTGAVLALGIDLSACRKDAKPSPIGIDSDDERNPIGIERAQSDGDLNPIGIAKEGRKTRSLSLCRDWPNPTPQSAPDSRPGRAPATDEQTPAADHDQPGIESLAALWTVVGRQLPAWRFHPAGSKEAVSKATDRALHPLQHQDRPPPADRLELARAAQQRAIERHARNAPVLADAGAACRLDERDDGTVVDRTEFAHESWED